MTRRRPAIERWPQGYYALAACITEARSLTRKMRLTDVDAALAKAWLALSREGHGRRKPRKREVAVRSSG